MSRFNKSTSRTARVTTRATGGVVTEPVVVPGEEPGHETVVPANTDEVASEDAAATMTDEGSGADTVTAADTEQDASNEDKSKKRRFGRRKKGEEQHG